MDSDSITIKLRLPDKKQHLSKSDGYRLIYLVLKGSPVVAFLTIYPKRGPLQELDIEDLELRKLISEFTVESRAHQIMIHELLVHRCKKIDGQPREDKK